MLPSVGAGDEMRRGFSIPLTRGLRGGGLGNEVIPWAKAFIASREFGLQLMHPAWGLNARRYSRDFRTSSADWIGQGALRIALPTRRITDAMVRETGEDDYALALRALTNELNIRRRMPTAVLNEGMSGGYYGIQRARDFLHQQLVRPRHVAEDLYFISETLDPDRITVAVHVRASDFESQSNGPAPGQFSTALPGSWYEAVIAGFDQNFGEAVQYLVFSDTTEIAFLRRLISRKNVIISPRRRRPLLSDLLSMVNADVLLCSVSSFSMLAAFLSEKPYLWFEPHLSNHGGWRSLWGHEESQQAPHGLTAHNIASAAAAADPIFGRGVAVGVDGQLPDELLELVEKQAFLKRRRHDLLYYGVIRTGGSGAS